MPKAKCMKELMNYRAYMFLTEIWKAELLKTWFPKYPSHCWEASKKGKILLLKNRTNTAQKMKFSIKAFLSKCEEILYG